jgi:Domain of unknown function (DUF4296)
MKKIIVFVLVLATLMSCKKEIIKKPKRFIEKGVMVNIMYDLSLFDAIKYQSPATLDSAKITPTQYIYRKYKVDSLQFAQNNKYYAADFKEYKKMYDEIASRVEKNKTNLEAKIKAKKKKISEKAPISKSLSLDSIEKSKKIPAPL